MFGKISECVLSLGADFVIDVSLVHNAEVRHIAGRGLSITRHSVHIGSRDSVGAVC